MASPGAAARSGAAGGSERGGRGRRRSSSATASSTRSPRTSRRRRRDGGCWCSSGGEAGVGKTRSSAVRRAQRGSARILTRRLRGGASPARSGRCSRSAGAPGARAGPASASREELFEGFLEEASARTPTVMVVEDVHWADEATLDMLRSPGPPRLAAAGAGLATYRDDEVGRDHPLTQVLDDMATLPSTRRMALPRLTEHGVAALAGDGRRRRDGPVPVDRRQRVLRHRGAGHPPGAPGDGVPAPSATPCWPGRPACRRPPAEALDAASVVGFRVEPWLLEGRDGGRRDAVDECVERGMLRTEEPVLASGTSLPGGRSRSASRGSSAVAPAPDHPRRPSRTASRRGRGRPAGAPRRGGGDGRAVLAYALAAARRAAQLGAHREAVQQYERARRFAAGLSRGSSRPRRTLRDRVLPDRPDPEGIEAASVGAGRPSPIGPADEGRRGPPVAVPDVLVRGRARRGEYAAEAVRGPGGAPTGRRAARTRTATCPSSGCSPSAPPSPSNGVSARSSSPRRSATPRSCATPSTTWGPRCSTRSASTRADRCSNGASRSRSRPSSTTTPSGLRQPHVGVHHPAHVSRRRTVVRARARVLGGARPRRHPALPGGVARHVASGTGPVGHRGVGGAADLSPQIAPVSRVMGLIVLGPLGRAAGRPRSWGPSTRPLALAEPTGELQRLGPWRWPGPRRRGSRATPSGRRRSCAACCRWPTSWGPPGAWARSRSGCNGPGVPTSPRPRRRAVRAADPGQVGRGRRALERDRLSVRTGDALAEAGDEPDSLRTAAGILGRPRRGAGQRPRGQAPARARAGRRWARGITPGEPVLHS